MYIKKLPEKFLENFDIYCKIYTMGKVIRLTESDLIRLVKKVINEESKNDLLEFERLMELNQFKLIKFGTQDFKQIPTGVRNIAKNMLYRGIPKYKQFKDTYVYIWLDSEDLNSNPFVNLSDMRTGDYKRFYLQTQLNELKNFIDKEIVKIY
jgi:hypothetical protein